MSDITEMNLEDALWFPEDYDWSPSQTVEKVAQGGGTAVWSSDQKCYVFKTPPEWWKECSPGDPVPSEWGVS